MEPSLLRAHYLCPVDQQKWWKPCGWLWWISISPKGIWQMHYPSSCIFLAYFANDLYEGLVCRLCLTIPLGVIRRWPMVLDLVELQHLPFITILLTKGMPLSLIILWDTPNLTIMFSLMKFATTPPVALWSGTASAHLVKYSLATRIYMYLCDGGLTGPTKSRPQVWKGHGVTMLCKFCGWVWIKLACTW